MEKAKPIDVLRVERCEAFRGFAQLLREQAAALDVLAAPPTDDAWREAWATVVKADEDKYRFTAQLDRLNFAIEALKTDEERGEVVKDESADFEPVAASNEGEDSLDVFLAMRGHRARANAAVMGDGAYETTTTNDDEKGDA